VATGGSYKWTYDANGNLTTQLGDNGYPVTYTYTPAITPNEVQTMVMGDGQPTAYYAYDGHGDTTAITDGNLLNTHLAYDSQARPVQITKLDHCTRSSPSPSPTTPAASAPPPTSSSPASPPLTSSSPTAPDYWGRSA